MFIGGFGPLSSGSLLFGAIAVVSVALVLYVVFRRDREISIAAAYAFAVLFISVAAGLVGASSLATAVGLAIANPQDPYCPFHYEELRPPLPRPGAVPRAVPPGFEDVEMHVEPAPFVELEGPEAWYGPECPPAGRSRAGAEAARGGTLVLVAAGVGYMHARLAQSLLDEERSVGG